MAETATEAAKRLEQVDVDVVAYGCTTGSLIKGHEYARTLESKLGEASDAEAVTTALSVERALEQLDIESVSVATPYNDTLNQREVDFLEQAGFSVECIIGKGFEDNLAIGALTPSHAYRQGRRVVTGEEDALFISCTNYRSFEVVSNLEADLGIPVVTSNQATLWDALRVLEIPLTHREIGRDLQSPSTDRTNDRRQ